MLLPLFLKLLHLIVSSPATKHKCKNRADPPPTTAPICINLFSTGALAGLLWKSNRNEVKTNYITYYKSVWILEINWCFSLPIGFPFVESHGWVCKKHHRCSVAMRLKFHKRDNQIALPAACLHRYWPVCVTIANTFYL